MGNKHHVEQSSGKILFDNRNEQRTRTLATGAYQRKGTLGNSSSQAKFNAETASVYGAQQEIR
jgi:hypothetical protein